MGSPFEELAKELVRENVRRVQAFDTNPTLSRFLCDFITSAKEQADAKGIPWADAKVEDLRLTTEGYILFSVQPDVEKITKRLGLVLPPDPGKNVKQFDKALRTGGVDFGA